MVWSFGVVSFQQDLCSLWPSEVWHLLLVLTGVVFKALWVFGAACWGSLQGCAFGLVVFGVSVCEMF